MPHRVRSIRNRRQPQVSLSQLFEILRGNPRAASVPLVKMPEPHPQHRRVKLGLVPFHVWMPLIYPWRTAYGEDAAVHSVLCRMTSGALAGWGESSPLAAPCYSPEWGGGVFGVLKEWLAPALVGQAVDRAEHLQRRLAHFKA